MKMAMAKPTRQDIEAAEELMQALYLIDELNRFARIKAPVNEEADIDLFDIEDFDQYDDDHLKALFNKLISLLHRAPNFHGRVISGMCHVIMYEKNAIIDPDSRIIDLHPRFEQMFNDLQRETQAARYWNKRYHEVLNARNEHVL